MTEMHPLLRDDPRQVAIERERAQVDRCWSAFARHAAVAEEEYAKAVKEFRSELSRAMGAEEIASLVEPVRPAILEPENRRSVLAERDARRRELDEREHRLHAGLHEELREAIALRKRELRDETHAILRPVLKRLQERVAELEQLRALERTLGLALSAADRRLVTRTPDTGATVTLAAVLADALDGLAAPQPRRERRLTVRRDRDTDR